MVAHPLAVSRMRAFVDALAEGAEAPWNTSVDIHFIIAGVEERTIIVDLRCWMRVPTSDPFLRTDPVIGSTLNH